MSDAYEKFLASAPTAQREFRTIELYHPSFSQIYRFVKDFEDQTLTLESTAPRNPNADVLFTAISMEINEPSETQDTEQTLRINLGAIGGEVETAISQIVGEDYLTPIDLVYRKYYSGDLSTPVVVLILNVSNVNFEGYEIVNFTGEDIDFANKQSGELYTLERFVALEGI